LKALSLAIILLVLCLYSFIDGLGRLQSISRSLDDPQAREGATVEIAFAKVVELRGEDRILLTSRGREFEVRAPHAPIRVGERMSVSGRLRRGGYVEAETIVIHRYRWVKKLVSVLAAAIVCLLVVTRYRISLAGRCIVDRGSCLT
jgi:hypothetical protein